MADNVFKITIVAVDKATAIARGVNQAFAKFTKPVNDLHKSVANLGRETGLFRLAKTAGSAASAMGAVAKQATAVATPLAAIAGIGVTASIVEMTRAWVDQGAEIARTSRLIGVYQGDLQSMRATARLFGVDAGSATGALQQFGNTVQGALFGRNQEALAMLSALHVGVVRLKDGSIDTVTMMKRVADSVQFQRANAETKQFIASTLGLSGVLPVMLKGSAAIDAYQKDMQRLGAVQSDEQIRKAEEFAIAQQRLGIAFTGVSNTIMSRVIPVFQPIIDHTTEWLAKNRELISQRFEYYARRIADAIEHIDWDKVDRGLHEVVSGVRFVVDALGGLRNTAIVVGVALNAGLAYNLLRLTGLLGKFAWQAGGVAARGIAILAAGLPGLALKAGVAFEGLAGLTAELPLVGAAMEGLSGVFIAFGAALEVTPIGWIITGLAAIAGAGYLVYENWTRLKTLFKTMWNVPLVRGYIWATMPLVGVAVELVKHWTAVWDTLKSIGRWLADSWIGKALSWSLTGDVNAFRDALSKEPDKKETIVVAESPATRGHAVAAPRPDSTHLRTPQETVGRHFPVNIFSRGEVPANDVAGSAAPRGVRNNNPGNLNFVGQAGAGTDGRFATFPNMQAGVDALNRQLKLYESRGINSVDGIISKFAPANENNTETYKASVAKDLRVDAKQPLKLDAPTLAKLDRAIVSVEDGRRWADKIFGGTPSGDSLARRFGAVAIASAMSMPPSVAAAAPTVPPPTMPALAAAPVAIGPIRSVVPPAAAAPPVPAAPTMPAVARAVPLVVAPTLAAQSPAAPAGAAMAIPAPAAPPMPGPYSQPSPSAAAAPQTASAGTASDPAKIVVHFVNAPAGMTASVKGQDADRVTLRIERAMPGILP
jgi:hypothetical protein